MTMLNRRHFIRSSLAGSLLLGTTLRTQATPSGPAERSEPGQAKNVIFLVSDGMSLGTLTMAEHYRRRVEGRGTHWLGLYQKPELRRALMETSSASSLVTDSAAASSAWGCGFKVKNGTINITPDGVARTPLLSVARGTGRSTGLVTTARITHATPAGFAVQADSRVDENWIAEQYLQRGIEVLLGGGAQFFEAGSRPDHKELTSNYADSGYQVIRDRKSLVGLTGEGKLLGLFGNDHLPYSLDTQAEKALSASTPTLAEMTQVALERLSRNPSGFVLQVEGARVDHAAHANDIGPLIHDQLAFDDAVGVVRHFVEQRNDTLVILTTDHGNANPGLNGTGGSFDSRGGSYGDTQVCFDRLAEFRRSNAWVMKELRPDSTLSQIRDRVREANGIALLDDEAELLSRALRKDPAPREAYRVRNAPLITLGQLVSNYTSIGWTGTQHTADLVELAAFGPGAERVQGLIQNNELFGIMTHAMGVHAARAV